MLRSQEDDIFQIFVPYLLQISRSRGKLRISNFRNGETAFKSKEHIAQPYLGVGYILGLDAGKPPDSSAGNYANLLMREEILRIEPIGILFLETCHNVVEEQHQLQLVTEDPDARLGDVVCMEGKLHLHLTTLGLVRIAFLFLNF